MSEFSDSFHLRSTDPQDAIALLRRAKAPGYVFPPADGFVTFVCPRDEDVPKAVLAANVGLLIDYSFAEDHGCWVDVYERDAKVASLSVDFDEQRAHFERSKFIAKGLLDAGAAEDVARWIRGSPDAEARSGREAYVIARKLRLPRFAWLSYRYAQTDETPPEGRIEVDRSGRTRTIEEAEMDDIGELLATLPPTRKPRAPPTDKTPTATKKAATKKAATKKAATKKARAQ
jgi:hypothetical protein